MILAGDVGGTKTLLGLFREDGGKLALHRESRFSSQDHPSFQAMVEEFLAIDGSRPRRAAFGVAGPVVDGRSHVVNLRWPIDARRLAGKLGLESVQVLNDVEATAWGIPELPSRRFANLTPRLRARPGTAALIAAGTGLGMALLVPSNGRLQVCASEGGHQNFAPRDDLEIELLCFLRDRHGRVSTERIVSGPGFSALYQFLVETGRGRESPETARRLAQAEDPNVVIGQLGVAGEDELAEKAVELFVSIYGSAAGDLALVSKAIGGVYIGGGIAPKILPRLCTGAFVRSFQTKGRLTPLLEKIPVRVILEPRTALIGAAACAARTEVPQSSASRRTRATGGTPGKPRRS